MVFPGISGAPLLIKPPSGIKVQDVFNTSLWTGTGAARTITTGINSGEGSLVWSKSRSAANGHILVDTARGAGNYLSTNSTGASVLNAQSVSSFTSTGYDLGTSSDVNGSGTTQVGWQFRRAPKFFDIVQYTGDGAANRAIAHNLGITPGMIVIKNTNTIRDWIVYHRSVSTGSVMTLNSTNAASAAAYFPSVTTSSFSVDGVIGSGVNGAGQSYIAYLFAHDPSPEGLIQCGSYVGNGSATGPVVNLGWRPQYLMIKAATTTGNWFILDTARGIAIDTEWVLVANLPNAEFAANYLDLNPTGFQLNTSASALNGSGQTYIYMAIREAA